MDEFLFLSHLKQHFRFGKLGDDCAVLPMGESTDLLATTDMLVEGIDFRLEWTEASSIGHKSLAVSLSDIAAMGGEPLWSLVSIAVPEALWNQTFLDEFYSGLKSLADIHHVEVVGGDVSSAGDRLVIDSIVLGRCDSGKAILRSGAIAGDLIFVSGSLGGAAAGLRLLEQDDLQENMLPESRVAIEKQLKPIPQVQLGKLLGIQQLASSMIDLSDGLSSDLLHLCKASNTGARIYGDRIPVDPSVIRLASHSTGAQVPDVLALALDGGEDFELLMTAGSEHSDELSALGCTVIGEMLSDPGRLELVADETVKPLTAKGFRHFS